MANLLRNSQVASFKGIELHRYLARITDTIGVRTVVYEFPKRDGAAGESFGLKPFRTSWDLDVGGARWIELQKDLVRAIQESPRGLLVHPVYGQMTVLVEGDVRAVIEPPRSLAAVAITIAFVAVALDASLAGEETKSLGDATQQVMVAQSNLTTEIATRYPALAAQAAAVNAAATRYSTVAALVYTSPGTDASSLAAELALVGSSSLALRQALGGRADAWDALTRAEQVHAAVLELDLALRSLRPVETEYVVPADTNLVALAADWFGGRDAIARSAQIRDLQGNVAPPLVPAGTRLRIPSR